jgi:hypothetical protein
MSTLAQSLKSWAVQDVDAARVVTAVWIARGMRSTSVGDL